jgi:GNAT superfamily N-acetyltransferase
MNVDPAPMSEDYEARIAEGSVDVALYDAVECGVIVTSVLDTLWIDVLAVDPRFQGRGVGDALIHRVIEVARQCGLWSLRLYTNVVMTESLDFYRHRGFHEIDRRIEGPYERIYLERPIS